MCVLPYCTVCIHICMYIYIYMYIDTYICMYIYRCIYIPIGKGAHAEFFISYSMYSYMYMYVYIYVYLHIYMCIYRYIYTPIGEGAHALFFVFNRLIFRTLSLLHTHKNVTIVRNDTHKLWKILIHYKKKT